MYILKQIDDAANEYKRTRDIKYKNEWYRLIKRFFEMIGRKH
jgi:hypothetical protein|tara:strand:+ start:744 stop:869 length:126 start_codon:yes stop_codon:yes gene_type:complete